ncbi:MAG: hypothetical protein M3290_10465 [Actinomycetota bacterium]|nr:hypothetical protein [Actinomycetota bacterium]
MSDSERAARYRDLFAGSHDHGSDCSYCPFCSAIAVVRKTRPEVLDHLAIVARELITVAGLLLQEAEGVIGPPASEDEGGDQSHPTIRRIDVG